MECTVNLVTYCIENTRRIRRQESDGDGCAGEKKEMKTIAEVVGQHQKRFVRERIVQGGRARPGEMEASHKTHRLHIKVGKDAEEEVENCIYFTIVANCSVDLPTAYYLMINCVF